jgi:hypothetical protein
MATPIRHIDCGQVVMWYTGGIEDNVFRSANVRYLDWSRPVPGSVIPKCPHCKGTVLPGINLGRCFNEDIVPFPGSYTGSGEWEPWPRWVFNPDRKVFFDYWCSLAWYARPYTMGGSGNF